MPRIAHQFDTKDKVKPIQRYFLYGMFTFIHQIIQRAVNMPLCFPLSLPATLDGSQFLSLTPKAFFYEEVLEFLSGTCFTVMVNIHIYITWVYTYMFHMHVWCIPWHNDWGMCTCMYTNIYHIMLKNHHEPYRTMQEQMVTSGHKRICTNVLAGYHIPYTNMCKNCPPHGATSPTLAI